MRAAAARPQGPRTVHELSDHGEEHEAQRVFDKMLLWFSYINSADHGFLIHHLKVFRIL
jgi:hypothetical protein